ncbi:MAG: hypothetical protein J0M11_08830 [Anaerolineae bacterium]|nr:hypothetical protein [Anaerolineae bacterium]
MDLGHFYFLQDKFFVDFDDPTLMRNKEGYRQGRPCFYAFMDVSNQIYWMIPVSSQVEKYRRFYQNRITRYGRCDNIVFGELLGYERAFLIQNMFPTTSNYIDSEYTHSTANVPVRLDGAFEKILVQKAKKVLALTRQGVKLVYPDILMIEQNLINRSVE